MFSRKQENTRSNSSMKSSGQVTSKEDTKGVITPFVGIPILIRKLRTEDVADPEKGIVQRWDFPWHDRNDCNI